MLEPGVESGQCGFRNDTVFITLNCRCKTDEQGLLLECNHLTKIHGAGKI